MSSCGTWVPAFAQPGPATAPTADGWGCEILTASQQTKYVAAVHTDANGVVLAPIQGFSTVVSTSVVSLTLLSTATAGATMTAGTSNTLFGWRCGASADGTTVSPKYLPGSCQIGRASCRERE